MLRLAALLCPWLWHLAAAKQPHLVMMVLDDIGWSDVGYHGSDIPTPIIDTLATEQGVRLERYYVQQVCSPTRSALITGRYPFRIGMQHFSTLMPASTAGIPKDAPTIAEVLKQAGYSTHAIGKWHCGAASWSQTPIGRGFDSYLGYLQGQVDYYNQTIGGGFDFWQNKTVFWDARGTYTMEHYMREAQRILDSRDESKPMFLYFAHQQLHIPLEAPPGASAEAACAHMKATSPNDGKNRHLLCTMMVALDKAIGDFVSMLKAKNMWEDTVLWITTDNGGMTQWQEPWPASASSNFPLRGGKTTLFEGGVRGVSFVTGGLVPKKAFGTVRAGLMQHVDITRTLAALGGTDIVGSDGYNVWSSVTSGAPSPRAEAVLNVDRSWLSRRNFSAIIVGDLKLINGHANSLSPNTDGWWSNEPYSHQDVTESAKPVTMGGTSVWLFNLTEDAGEHKNIATEQPDAVARLQARLADLGKESNGYRAPQWNVPDPRGAYQLHGGVWKPFKRFSEDQPPLAEQGDAATLVV